MFTKRKRAKETMLKKITKAKEREFQVSSVADHPENVDEDELLDGALDDPRNHNLSQPSFPLQSTVDRLEQLKKLVEPQALAIFEAYAACKRKLAELTEAVKIRGLGTMTEQLRGKFDDLTEAGKQLETMIRPLLEDQIMKLVVKMFQEIISSESELAIFKDLEKRLNTRCKCCGTCETQDSMTAQAGGDGFSNNPIIVGWAKEFGNQVGASVCAISVAILGIQDIGMCSKIVTILQEFVPKLMLTFLCERMKHIGELYPKWLKENEASLSKEEYDRFFCQLKLIKHLNEVYEHDPLNHNKCFEMLQKIQECSEPPDAIADAWFSF